MKTALLAMLATASAIPVVAFSTIAPASGSKYNLWMKDLAARLAAISPAPRGGNDAAGEPQEVPNGSQPVPGGSAPAAPHMPGSHHAPPSTGAAPLTPVIVNGVASLPAVPSGLDADTLVSSGWTINDGRPDVVGAFRFHCEPSHLAYADPVVYPGDRSGKSHLHLFFGNTGANAHSTFESLRTTGDSTCINAGNRSAYWEPALIQTNAAGKDEVVIPHNLNIYYKRRPASDPWYKANNVTPVNIPRGLRFVFGWPDRGAQFKCVDPRDWSDTPWRSDMQTALAECKVGDQLDVSLSTPPCWDGKNLDSADHRSHMSYTRGGEEHNWVEKCPASHPYEIPTFTLQSMFTILPSDRVKTWRFSSDMMQPGAKPGSTFHADWFGAWEDKIADIWQDHCIDRLLSCAAGNLGNGTGMKESPLYLELKRQPEKRVPVPSV